jgi:hypothetical protein
MKSFYQSKSILGSLIAAVIYICGLFNLHIADLAPQILDAVSKQIDATVTIAGLVVAIYGRWTAKAQIKPLGPTPLATKSLLLVLVAGSASVLIGCSTTGETFSYTAAGASTPTTITGFGAWCENHLSVIQSAAKASAQAGADFLIKQGTTRTRIAGYVTSIESVLKPLLSAGTISQADLETAAAPLKLDNADGAYSEIAAPVLTLVGGYLVTLEDENVPSKVIVDVLNAVIAGFDAVAQEYAT